MKKQLSIYILSIFCLLAFNNANSQINMPQASAPGSVSGTVGLTEVTIDYFRPSVKGRKIFGEGSAFLQPYGQLWRSGANSGSVITFSTEVKMNGKTIPAGEYLIFTVPGKDTWEFMLYSDLAIGGNVAAYDKSKEVFRTSVKPQKLNSPVETLTYTIGDISEDNTSANIELSWANTKISVPFQVDFDAMVMEEIAKATKGEANANTYIQAANYYYATDRDMKQALEWINKGLEGNTQAFWNVHLKAKILAKMGNKKEAIAAAEESMRIAKAAESDFGYVKLNEDLIAEINKM